MIGENRTESQTYWFLHNLTNSENLLQLFKFDLGYTKNSVLRK